jgi:hypothetical protein
MSELARLARMVPFIQEVDLLRDFAPQRKNHDAATRN